MDAFQKKRKIKVDSKTNLVKAFAMGWKSIKVKEFMEGLNENESRIKVVLFLERAKRGNYFTVLF